MELEFIEYAYEFVNDYKYMNIKERTYNKFDFEYTVPSIKGITQYQWGKDLQSVRPSTLKYIIYEYHTEETKLLIDSIIAYLYYWKIRKADSKTMRNEYKKIKEHYTIKYDCNIPTVEAVPSVYYISFMVGTVKVYKVGYSKEPTRRFKEIIKSVQDNYPFVSVGSFEVLDINKFETEKEALTIEKKLLKVIQDKEIPKTNIYFEGATEGFSVPLNDV
jgi:hypothetical protein